MLTAKSFSDRIIELNDRLSYTLLKLNPGTNNPTFNAIKTDNVLNVFTLICISSYKQLKSDLMIEWFCLKNIATNIIMFL